MARRVKAKLIMKLLAAGLDWAGVHRELAKNGVTLKLLRKRSI